MHERRQRGYAGSSAGTVEAWPRERSPDDWLGDVSDEDWSENAAERAERRRAVPGYRGLPAPADDLWFEPPVDRSGVGQPIDADEARRADIERRRLVAGLAVVAVLALAVAIPAVLLRGGAEAPATPVAEPPVTTPAPSENDRSSAPPATPSTSPTTTPTDTPATPSATGFTLPEGTKLRLGEGDPALVTKLQQALSSAGYDPGPADGTFGRKTEAAAVAFQQDNGLSADGVVGPDTAAVLNSAESAPATTPETGPSTSGASGFTLPEGTKLRLGEGDAAVVTELQQALSSAGYDPGSADGTFGQRTQAAVTAFQQDNGLSADGVVGAETASALNSALAG